MTAPDPIRARLDELGLRVAYMCPDDRPDARRLLAAVRAVADRIDKWATSGNPIDQAAARIIRRDLATLTDGATPDETEGGR